MKTIISIFALLLLVGLMIMIQPVFAQNVEDGIVAYWAFQRNKWRHRKRLK